MSNDPDWDSFETYQGPPEKNPLPRWLGRLFHGFMILLCLSIVFSIGAIIAFFIAYDRSLFRGRTASYILSETPQQIQMRCIAGGIFAVIVVLYWRFRKT